MCATTRKNAKIKIPKVKKDMTEEEVKEVTSFFNDFAISHLLLARKPSKEAIKAAKMRFTRSELGWFSKAYESYDSYFVYLPKSFFAISNLKLLKECGDFYFDSYTSTHDSKYQLSETEREANIRFLKKIFDIEVISKIKELELTANDDVTV